MPLKRRLGRLAVIGLGVVGLLAAGLFGLIGYDTAFGRQATAYINVSFAAADGTPLHAYQALPTGPGPHPALLMIHEWWGLTEAIIHKADLMAEAGYAVLAVDTYRGASTDLVPRALFLRLTVPEARVLADLQAAYDYLAAQPAVDAGRVGVLGYCYGGGMALSYATQNPALAATVVYYGSLITDPAGFGALAQTGGPLLGIFGEDDRQIPVAEVRAFEQALTTAGIEHQVTVYPGVGHAFVQPDTLAVPGPAQDAWAETLAFLERHLQP
jgi:carboxymethylenebutenolidase